MRSERSDQKKRATLFCKRGTCKRFCLSDFLILKAAEMGGFQKKEKRENALVNYSDEKKREG